MQKSIILLFFFLAVWIPRAFSQENDSTNFSIYYSSPAKYTIADVQVTGIKYLDKSVLVQLSGLTVGLEIDVPGEAVTNAIKKLWQQGLFSDVKVTATITGIEAQSEEEAREKVLRAIELRVETGQDGFRSTYKVIQCRFS